MAVAVSHLKKLLSTSSLQRYSKFFQGSFRLFVLIIRFMIHLEIFEYSKGSRFIFFI